MAFFFQYVAHLLDSHSFQLPGAPLINLSTHPYYQCPSSLDVLCVQLVQDLPLWPKVPFQRSKLEKHYTYYSRKEVSFHSKLFYSVHIFRAIGSVFPKLSLPFPSPECPHSLSHLKTKAPYVTQSKQKISQTNLFVSFLLKIVVYA